MKKIACILGLFLLSAPLFAQELMKFEGFAQGTTYHITYYDPQFRDVQTDVVKLLEDFDKSVSTYIPTSIISRINANEKNSRYLFLIK